MNVQLHPFSTPNFVLMVRPPGAREDGPVIEQVSFPLKTIPAEDLAKLCDDFRAEVFNKAGKTDLRTR